jgi:hypothetical protein
VNSRRRFVKVTTAALGAALLPAGRVWASESPEVSAMKFGMIALTDCSPIVMARGVLRCLAAKDGAVVAKASTHAATLIMKRFIV